MEPSSSSDDRDAKGAAQGSSSARKQNTTKIHLPSNGQASNYLKTNTGTDFRYELRGVLWAKTRFEFTNDCELLAFRDFLSDRPAARTGISSIHLVLDLGDPETSCDYAGEEYFPVCKEIISMNSAKAFFSPSAFRLANMNGTNYSRIEAKIWKSRSSKAWDCY